MKSKISLPQKIPIKPIFRGIDLHKADWQRIYYAIPNEVRYAFERTQLKHFYIELDRCHGCCLLKQFKNLIAESLEFFHGKRVWVGDYVVMPNHVHVIVQPFEGVKLEEWLYSVKRYTAYRMRQVILSEPRNHRKGRRIWQQEYFDRLVRDRYELDLTRRYVADNPKNIPEDNYILKKMDWLDEFSL